MGCFDLLAACAGVLVLLLAACGHTYEASLGASRRPGGTIGVETTVGANGHFLDSGDDSGRYLLYGIRIGAEVYPDGDARAIVEGVFGYGRLPGRRGLAARGRVRVGTGVGGDLMLGVAWSHDTDNTTESFFPGTATQWTNTRFFELGVTTGAERASGGWRLDGGLMVGWGRGAHHLEPVGD